MDQRSAWEPRVAAVADAVRERGGQLLEILVEGADTRARRFYERHGYTNTEPGQDQPSFYYHRELTDAAP
jgi:hypothetical protein